MKAKNKKIVSILVFGILIFVFGKNLGNTNQTENINSQTETILTTEENTEVSEKERVEKKKQAAEEEQEEHEVIDYSSEVKEIIENNPYLSGTDTSTDNLVDVSFEDMESTVHSADGHLWDEDSLNEKNFSYEILIYLKYGILQACMEHSIDAAYSVDLETGLLSHPDIYTSTWLATAAGSPDIQITYNLLNEKMKVEICEGE